MTKSSHEDNPKSNERAKSQARPIEKAMAAERPAKMTVRDLWVEQAKYFDDRHRDHPFPLYLTLSGADATDIKKLIECNLVAVTETGAIATSDSHKVIAVEDNSPAILQLQKQLVGLTIIEQNFGHILKGENPLRFPESREHKRFCCASIVNLDFDSSLSFRNEGTQLVFPIFSWIEKLSVLHAAKRAGVDWCLCLSLNATLNNPQLVAKHVQDFLKENYAASAEFEASCLNLLGPDLQNSIKADDDLRLEGLDPETQQKLLMIFVPKKIARLVNGHGWKVSTLKNLSYGGSEGHAPMVTWILYFTPDGRAAAMPQTVYQESLAEILSFAGKIESDGLINQF